MSQSSVIRFLEGLEECKFTAGGYYVTVHKVDMQIFLKIRQNRTAAHGFALCVRWL